MKSSPFAALGLVALIAITLTGCDAAEESAHKLQEKAERAVQDLAHEAISDAVQAFNKQVDELQRAAEDHLGLQQDGATIEQPDEEVQAPATLPEQGIET
ncbi:hypothetical protein [Stutzerimonas zhaodongensis]|uniref:hypothetical protein n=1 Tax=Stutzerimonas TaxID=2901164 RepID=UPI00388DB2BD